jgi:hypothetical protein
VASEFWEKILQERQMNTKIDSIGFWNKESAYPTGKNGFPAFMAALALAIFTFAAAPARADPLNGTKWVAILGPQGYSGVSLLEFDTSDNTATGTFGRRDNMEFAYTFDAAANTGTLIEVSTKYDWDFTLGVDTVQNRVTLTFPDMAPYGEYQVTQTFYKIEFPPSATLSNLAGTNWLGWTNRGETLLDNIVSSGLVGSGDLDCTTGPAPPITGLNFAYIYGSDKGRGMVTTLGAFTTLNSTATMTFSNFMALGSPATFRLFNYVQPAK